MATRARNWIRDFGGSLVRSIIWVRDQFTFLRAEHIRSVAFLYVCWQGERSWRAISEGATLADPFVLITVLCLVSSIGLAWQATEAKVKFAGMMVELGQKPKEADSGFAQDMDEMPGPVTIDNPDKGAV